MNTSTKTLPDILMLTHRVPHPPDRGDRIRTYHILRMLSRRSRVHLACFADEDVGQETREVLEGLCARVATIPVSSPTRLRHAVTSLLRGGTASVGAFHDRRLIDVMSSWSHERRFHSALASASSLAPYLEGTAKAGVPVVVDLVDLDSQKWLDYAQASRGPRSWFYRLEGARLRGLERDLAKWAHALTLVSESEAELYRRSCGQGPVVAITNGVDLDYFQARSAPGRGANCVFVGALDYRPNVDGACWFASAVWTKVRRLRPGAKLVLVGRKPVAAVRKLSGIEGIEVVGQVPDVRPYVERAAVAVVPLRIARGVQNKVLEAMAMGRAVVTSPGALEGIAAVPGEHVEVAEEPDNWVRTVTTLLDDQPRRERLGHAARRFVEERHDWGTCLRPFAALLGLDSK